MDTLEQVSAALQNAQFELRSLMANQVQFFHGIRQQLAAQAEPRLPRQLITEDLLRAEVLVRYIDLLRTLKANLDQTGGGA